MRLRLTSSIVALLLLAGCARATAQELPRLGCDPYSWEQPEPVPDAQAIRCGDGELGTYTAACTRSCAGGCEHVSGCGPVTCTSAREVCDGAELDGHSCASLGFRRGTLTCSAQCTAFDVHACDPCLARTCGASVIPGEPSELRVVPGPSGTLALWHVEGELRWALVSAELRLGPSFARAGARLLDVLPRPGGWLVAAADEAGVALVHVGSTGVPTLRETLAGASGAELWAVRGGGGVLTTSTAFGSPFRWLGDDGTPATPHLPAHATREGSRMLLLDPGSAGAVVDPRPLGMHTEWAPRAGDFLIAFVRPTSSGVQLVRDGAIATGMGYSGDGPTPLDVHVGPVPASTGRGSDALWRDAVPDSPPRAGSGHLRMQHAGPRFTDTWEPHAGARYRVTGAISPTDPPRPPRPMFTEHAMVRWRGHFRDGRRLLGAALVADEHGTRVILAR